MNEKLKALLISDQDFHTLMESHKENVYKLMDGATEVKPIIAIASRDKNNTKALILVKIFQKHLGQQEKEAALMAVGAQCCLSLKVPEAVVISTAAKYQNEVLMVLAGQTMDGRTAITTAPLQRNKGKIVMGEFGKVIYNKELEGDMALLSKVYTGFLQQFNAMNHAFAEQRIYERITDEPSRN